jgi:hypothetical protein
MWKPLCRNHVDEEEKERKIARGAKGKRDDNMKMGRRGEWLRARFRTRSGT